MANEATVVEDPSIIRDFTVADGATIEQFTLCKFADPRTASAATGSGEPYAGIAFTEKKASDGQVNLGFAQDGIFVLTAASSDIAVGKIVVMSGANLIREAIAADLLTGAVVGKALEAIGKTTTGEVDTGVKG